MGPIQTCFLGLGITAIFAVIYFDFSDELTLTSQSLHDVHISYPKPATANLRNQSSRKLIEQILLTKSYNSEAEPEKTDTKTDIKNDTKTNTKHDTNAQNTSNAKPTPKSTIELTEETTIQTTTSKPMKTTVPDCSIHEGKPDQFQFIPLLSWPGSGNTWLRYLIEQATGWQTTTVSKGDKKLAPFFVGELDYPLSGKSIVQKTHYFSYVRNWYKEIDSYKLAHSCVLLIRSPIDAFLAEFQRKQTGANHTGFISPEQFYTVYKRRFQEQVTKWITNEVNSYSATYLNPIKKSCDQAYHVIFYDELKENTFEEVVKLVDFLEVQHKVEMKLRVGCLSRDQKGHAKRKKQDYDKEKIRKMIPAHLRIQLNEGLDRLNDTLGGRVPNNYRV